MKDNRGKLLAAFAVLAMVVCAFCVLAPATDGNTGTAATLEAKDLPADVDGIITIAEDGKYTLTAAITGSIVVNKGVTAEIDLAGFTITQSIAGAGAAEADNTHTDGSAIVNNGSLTVTDSSSGKTGKVIQTAQTSVQSALLNMQGATAVVKGGEWVSHSYTFKNLGTLTIEDGVTVKTTKESKKDPVSGWSGTSLIANGWYDGGNNTSQAEAVLTINGGNFANGLNTLKNDDWGVAVINGGTFTNNDQAVVLNWNVLTINGGTFTANEQLFVSSKFNDTSDQGKMTITGGTFTPAPGYLGIETVKYNSSAYTVGEIVIGADVTGIDVKIHEGTGATGSVSFGDNKVTMSGIVAGSGGIIFSKGSIEVSGNIVSGSGSATEIEAVMGSDVVLKDLTITSGTLTVTGEVSTEGTVTISSGAGLTVSDGAKITVTSGSKLDIADKATFTNQGNAVVEGTIDNKGTAKNDGTIELVGTGSVSGDVEGNKPEGNPDREFTNRITLDDGAVIDANSSINASTSQEVIITGDVRIVAGGSIILNGKLTIQNGASLTVEEGAKVDVSTYGIVDVQGELIIEKGTDKPTFEYLGCGMTVSGSVTTDGANSFVTTSTDKKVTGKGIVITGTFEVGETAEVVLDNAEIAEGGELTVYGVIKTDAGKPIVNNGTITVDSQGLSSSSKIDMTVQIGATGTVDVINVFGKIVVSDSDLTFMDGKKPVDAKNDSTVTLENVAGVVVSENLVIEKDGNGNNVGNNTLLVSGNVAVADNFDSSAVTGSKITVNGANVEIAEATILGDGVVMAVNGKLTVSSDLDATADPAENKITLESNGVITVTGKMTVSKEITIGQGKINASKYKDADNNYVYTTLETALADGATSIEVLGENTVVADATIPVGTTVKMTDGAKLTVSEKATLTVVSDDRKSGKLNATADDCVVVDGTLVAQNFAKSGIAAGAVLSDTSKQVDATMTFTNIYNALENAADGETVKVTRGEKLDLTKNVEIRSGVTLLIPTGETVNVANDVTVTVNGTLRNEGTYDMAEKTETKAAGTTVVNGMFLTTDSSLYTDRIVGAYFGYDGMDAIAPLAEAARLCNDIESETVELYGDMDLGGIDFSGYTGNGLSVVPMNSLKISTITLGTVVFDASKAVSVTGTVVLANGSVNLENVKGIVASDSIAEDVTTSAISGNVTAYDDAETPAAETGSVTIIGEVSSSVGTDATVALVVPKDAKLTVTAGNLQGEVDVAGSVTIAGNSVTFGVLTVTGTVTATEGTTPATATKMYIGITDEDYAMAGQGSVSGVTLATGKDSVAYVSPNATVGAIFDNLESTAYMVDSELYLTAYANASNSVLIKDVEFRIENARFDGWVYDNNGTDVTVETEKVGIPDKVFAKIERNIFNVTVYVDSGIGSVSIDGNVLINDSGNGYKTPAPIAAGVHKITYTLKSGYTGEATLTVASGGATVSGLDFTLAGTPASGEINVTLSLAGTEPKDTTIVVENGNGGNDGLGLTDILLIVLVVLIVIMAIIVAMRLMRS